MDNFEKIEAYISGKMDAQEKQAFEQDLNADPTLKSEVAMQRAIIESVKKARVAELKGMLSQVPLTGVEGSLGISMTKIAVTVAAAGALIAASFFYFKQEPRRIQTKTIKDSVLEKIEIPATDVPTLMPKDEDIKTGDSIEQSSPSEKSNKPSGEKKRATSALKQASKPKIEVVDPTNELTNDNTIESTKTDNNIPVIAASHIPVETHEGDKKYSFHYQFSDGKLMLYGSFDKGLYEVIEVNGNAHSMFLFYKDVYYQLNERTRRITPLVPIKDTELISKLKQFRSQ